MSVSLPNSTTGSVVSEFAASQSNTTRQIQSINGEMVPVFSGSISYQRTDYLVADGKKVGVIQSEMGGVADPTRYGNVYMDPATLGAALAADPALAAAFQKVADFEDSLVKADLINRKILA